MIIFFVTFHNYVKYFPYAYLSIFILCDNFVASICEVTSPPRRTSFLNITGYLGLPSLSLSHTHFLSVCLSFYVSLCLSVHLCPCLCLCLSVSLPLSLSLSLYLSIYLSILVFTVYLFINLSLRTLQWSRVRGWRGPERAG